MSGRNKRPAAAELEDIPPKWIEQLTVTLLAQTQTILRPFIDAVSELKESNNRIHELISTHLTHINDNKHRLEKLESGPSVNNSDLSNVMYNAVAKVQTDQSTLGQKACRITWVGIQEKDSDQATFAFDSQALREVVEASENNELVQLLNNKQISCKRHPEQRNPNSDRPRIIKIQLPTPEHRDNLLQFMRKGRQSLTRTMVHSYARRDYTQEQLELDRSTRREAGRLNAEAGELVWVVRDMKLFKLRTSRPLPARSVRNNNPTPPSNTASQANHQFARTSTSTPSSVPMGTRVFTPTTVKKIPSTVEPSQTPMIVEPSQTPTTNASIKPSVASTSSRGPKQRSRSFAGLTTTVEEEEEMVIGDVFGPSSSRNSVDTQKSPTDPPGST